MPYNEFERCQMHPFLVLPKLSRGDQVAVISPSAGLPGLFPWVQELGLRRLREVFALEPVEYPTTRRLNAPLEARARDVLAAFANPAHKAVFASIGGTDQLRLLKYLDPAVFLAHPKPFFGFSDSTHLHLFLWNLGIPSYYGGAVMTQLAMPGHMHDFTVQSLTNALFHAGEVEIAAAAGYTDEASDWANSATWQAERRLDANEGWHWDGTADGAGRLWGGCVESLLAQVAAEKYLPSTAALAGSVLYLETSESMPPPWVVAYLLIGLGERGWLNHFQAILVGRPKAWDFAQPLTKAQKAVYCQQQRETVVKTVRAYNAHIPIVQNIDFGHTDPQLMLPSGQVARVLGSEHRIFLTY
ncbi:LD-carboxypeptidase [Hymenobacter sp. RP-2-7]|uniref:LD-carboxypeptidase n=1 Tax=Hymenobacter polaris TaxID=2682546 RepID=A0A7Y0FMH6_9BACT|nr:S66 peptidase family protein [Hymenobacter polaris]NML65893.1 LD-carboxypeptidase [Hymenobacter polaris]